MYGYSHTHWMQVVATLEILHLRGLQLKHDNNPWKTPLLSLRDAKLSKRGACLDSLQLHVPACSLAARCSYDPRQCDWLACSRKYMHSHRNSRSSVGLLDGFYPIVPSAWCSVVYKNLTYIRGIMSLRPAVRHKAESNIAISSQRNDVRLSLRPMLGLYIFNFEAFLSRFVIMSRC